MIKIKQRSRCKGQHRTPLLTLLWKTREQKKSKINDYREIYIDMKTRNNQTIPNILDGTDHGEMKCRRAGDQATVVSNLRREWSQSGWGGVGGPVSRGGYPLVFFFVRYPLVR